MGDNGKKAVLEVSEASSALRCILLDRAEAPHGAKAGIFRANSIEDADKFLNSWRITAPGKDGGYHKIFVTFKWDDGKMYRFRYDLTFCDTEGVLARALKYIKYETKMSKFVGKGENQKSFYNEMIARIECIGRRDAGSCIPPPSPGS